MKNLAELKDKENIKTEIYALSSIREALHGDGKHAEGTVITNVQKRLQDLVNETNSEKETTSSLRNTTVKVNFESLGTGIDKFKAEINKYLYEAAGVAFPAIKKDEELTEMVKEMSKTGAVTIVEAVPLLKVGVGFADTPREQLKTVLHVIADRVASECQDLDKLNDEGRLRELSYLIDAYGSLYSKLL
ncbi:hypothetical protein [Sporosarcina sp. FSL K6-1508]|uniref:hypothetical protein n=1 Tax=Sporosarcina sp. FSL K6-1508 TaxID=2921553 RepID=UPI0030FC5648